jgi:deazaflavin-dependent oxidoreductase (nitroreductase family)
MSFLYRIGLLPLFGMDRNVMLLTTRGRKSGKLRSIPIGYFRIGGAIHLFSAWGKGTAWYRNITAHPDEVWIQVGMRKQAVRAKVVEDREEIQRTLDQFVRESPEDARMLFGWDAGMDRFENANFSMVIERVLIIRFFGKHNQT